MPARRLGRYVTSLSKYDVVGIDSDAEVEFVAHVGLAKEEWADVHLKVSLEVLHMGPPLEIGNIQIHACGTAELNFIELRQIQVFRDELELEYEAEKLRSERQYTIMPHCREPDASCSVKRFSCAGFVIEAYRYAGIDLVTTNLGVLPALSLETLSKAYPSVARHLSSHKIRKQFGLEGEGPWPVVLAGYALNALNRTAEDIRNGPFQPSFGDEYFPSKNNDVNNVN